MILFSAFRDPAQDTARCASQNNCQGIVRARCSAHRTGLAMDIYLGTAPGFKPSSTDDANRLFISRGPAYRWLAANAGRFGFVNYPFEPWHWEWTGEPIISVTVEPGAQLGH
jgi:LAS superfamily LD-carboxypeptidase LdcB